jgi:hypothetical protein
MCYLGGWKPQRARWHMAIGPGRYDDLCTEVREKAGVTELRGGGVVLIVIGGNRGSTGMGFSIQADLRTTLQLPTLLRMVAESIEQDGL